MLQVRCPASYEQRTDHGPKLFIAGGISGCREWQSDLLHMLRFTNYCVFNPRRENFPAGDRAELDFQIRWEHAHLAAADVVSFWFPPETLCPITLLELGKVAMSSSKMFVAAHPKYLRRDDVEIQLSLIRPEVKVVDSLELLAHQLMTAT